MSLLHNKHAFIQWTIWLKYISNLDLSVLCGLQVFRWNCLPAANEKMYSIQLDGVLHLKVIDKLMWSAMVWPSTPTWKDQSEDLIYDWDMKYLYHNLSGTRRHGFGALIWCHNERLIFYLSFFLFIIYWAHKNLNLNLTKLKCLWKQWEFRKYA